MPGMLMFCLVLLWSSDKSTSDKERCCDGLWLPHTIWLIYDRHHPSDASSWPKYQTSYHELVSDNIRAPHTKEPKGFSMSTCLTEIYRSPVTTTFLIKHNADGRELTSAGLSMEES